MDHHVPRAITNSLRLRNVDVVTAHDGMSQASDSDLLNRATEYKRVLFSRDDDLFSEAARRQQETIPFAGVGKRGHFLALHLVGLALDMPSENLDGITALR